jgi:predicted exporter
MLAHNVYLWRQQRFKPDTDILALLPTAQRDSVRQRALERIADAARQKLVVLIGADDWEKAQRAVAAYRKVIASSSHLIDGAEAFTEGFESDGFAVFRSHRLGLLAAWDEAALQVQERAYWTNAALAKLYSPVGVGLLAWQEDPFGWFGNWLQERARETPVRPRAGSLSVNHGERQYIVLPMTLSLPAFAVTSQETIMPVLEQARRAALMAADNIEVVQTGMMLHAAAAATQARQEMSIIGVGSMLGILMLVWMTFRSLKPMIYVSLAITVGCLGALSISALVFGRVHLITLVFGASLIGVAEDYGIYFLCRRLGADAELGSWQLLERILPALALTLLTTLIGYLGLGFAPFPGLRQMAVFSACGLLFAWLTVVFWFPSLLGPNTLQTCPLARRYGIAMMRWPRFVYSRSTLGVALALAVLLGFGVARLKPQDDLRALQNSPRELINDQLKLGKILDLPAPIQFFLLRGSDAETLLQREEGLKRRLDSLVQQKHISGYHAISNWVPSARRQALRRQAIEQVILNDHGALAAVAQRIGADAEWLSATRARLKAAATPITIEQFFQTPASEPWRHLWLGRVGDEHASVIALRGVNKSSLAALSQAAAGLEGVEWVDQVGEISHLLGDYRVTMSWVILFSYVAVYALLYTRYGRHSWRVLTPTVIASLLALTCLSIGGQGIQLFHVLALMLLLGIGVDYGIFMQEPVSYQDGTASLAVMVSALSTLLSFGLLGLSKTPALRAFGLTMAIGVGAVIFLVPYFRNTSGPYIRPVLNNRSVGLSGEARP